MSIQEEALALATTEDEYEALLSLVESQRLNVRLPSDPRFLESRVARNARDAAEDQDRLWRFYASQIKSFLDITGSANNLQIATALNPVRWADTQFGPYYFHIDAADTMPEPGGGYAKSSNSFSERYYDFLASIDPAPVDANALKESQKAEDERRQDYIRLKQVELVYAKEWAAYDKAQIEAGVPPARRVTCEQWYKDVEADKSIQAQRDIVNAKEGIYLYWLLKALSPDEAVLGALKRYRDFKNTSTLKVNVPRNSISPDGSVREITDVLPYVVSPDFPSWLNEAPQRPSNLKMKYSRESSTYEYSKTRVAGGAYIGFGFFGAIGRGSRTTVTINASSDTFKFEFSAVAETFNLLPDRWYDSSIFDLYRDGPFKDGSPIQKAAQEGRLFGTNGYIGFRPSRAFIAYKPKAVVTFTQEDYSYYEQQTSGWAAFGIGPFVVGAAGYSDVQIRAKADKQNGTIELFAEDNLPYLLGFDYEDMGPPA